MSGEQFRVEKGRIQNPGKFEGEPIWVPVYWEKALDGFSDEEEQDGEDGPVVSWFKVGPEDIAEFPELTPYRVIGVWEDSFGFVRGITKPVKGRGTVR